MDVGHLHLHVRDPRRAASFYQRWFGLDIVREDDGITFLAGSRAFLLALMADADPAPPPPWFHFGVPLASAAAVRDLLARMEAAAVPIAKPFLQEPNFASFRCRDPDGYAIELYWDGGTADTAATAPPRA